MLHVRITILAACLLGIAGSMAAQDAPRDASEFGMDFAMSRNTGRAPTRAVTAPLSIRFGAYSTDRRLGVESRFTMLDDRLESGGKSAFTSAVQLNYRLASVSSGFGGSYMFGAVSLTSTRLVLSSAQERRWLIGPQAGLGHRILVPGGAVRAEVVASYDPGHASASASLPSRTSMGLRLGYSVLSIR